MTPPPNPHYDAPCIPASTPWDSDPSFTPTTPFSISPITARCLHAMSSPIAFVDVVDALDAMMLPSSAPIRLHFRKVRYRGMKAQASSGEKIVEWLLAEGFVSSRSKGGELARELVKMGGLLPTYKVENSVKSFMCSEVYEYVHRGLSAIAERGLNGVVAYGAKSRSLVEVLIDIGAKFTKVVELVVDGEGRWVEYEEIRGSEGWRGVLVLLTELVGCDDAAFEEVEDYVKKACWMNLYNVLIFHAKLVFGHPQDLVKRSRFFNEAIYVVAGKRITSVELEHGILRRKMKEGDPRQKWMLKEKDPRMHFILNCGAQSCPPLVVLDHKRIVDMLEEATSRFIDANCEVDLVRKQVTLSRLWKWFRNDFTPESAKDAVLIQWVLRRSSEEKKSELDALMMMGEPKIKFDVYNWADNGDREAKPDVRFMVIYDRSFAKSA